MVVTNTISPDCIPLNAVFTATSTPAANTYNWSFGNGQSSTQASPTETYTSSGTFAVTLTVRDIQGCINTASTSVTSFAIPIADFTYGQQPVSILSPEVQFTNESTPGLPYYNWSFGDVYSTPANNLSTLINPSHLYSVVDTFFVTLTVSTISGCSASVKKPIIINDAYTLYVPNAFTPNGDGKNEIFLAEGEGINDFKMYIFDRWGLLLYYSEDITKGWDGTYQAKGAQILQEDVYVWKIQATDIQNVARNLHGTVTLVK
jgi:gliding motility-associated-like protein